MRIEVRGTEQLVAVPVDAGRRDPLALGQDGEEPLGRGRGHGRVAIAAVEGLVEEGREEDVVRGRPRGEVSVGDEPVHARDEGVVSVHVDGERVGGQELDLHSDDVRLHVLVVEDRLPVEPDLALGWAHAIDGQEVPRGGGRGRREGHGLRASEALGRQEREQGRPWTLWRGRRVCRQRGGEARQGSRGPAPSFARARRFRIPLLRGPRRSVPAPVGRQRRVPARAPGGLPDRLAERARRRLLVRTCSAGLPASEQERARADHDRRRTQQPDPDGHATLPGDGMYGSGVGATATRR